jgi:hypothetical protein
MNIPHVWRGVINALRNSGFPEAVIAGGALRDLDNGRPVKDVDIFLKYRIGLKEQLDDYFGQDGKVIIGEQLASYSNALIDVTASYEYRVGETVFNIVALARDVTPEVVRNRIDFGLCRISFDGEKVEKSPEYDTDQANKTMTLHRCESSEQYNRSMQRFERLSAKYPEHKLVVPAHLAIYHIPPFEEIAA